MTRLADPAGRERILNAATALFYVNGVRAVGMAEVTASAGCGKNMLYRYFPSKAALVAAYLTRVRAERDRAVAAALTPTDQGGAEAPTRGGQGNVDAATPTPTDQRNADSAAGAPTDQRNADTAGPDQGDTVAVARSGRTMVATAGRADPTTAGSAKAEPVAEALVAMVAEVAAWVQRSDYRGCAFRNYLTEFPTGDDEPAVVARAYLRDTRQLTDDLVAALGAPPLLADRLWLLVDALYAGTGTDPQVAVDWARELVTTTGASHELT